MECCFPMNPNRFADDVRCWPKSGKHLLLLSFSVFDPERTLIAEERPRQRGSEYGLRAGDAELNRCHLRRAKVGSRQIPGPIALRKRDGENARPLLCRTTRKRSFQLPPPSHSGPGSNGSFSQPAISSTPATSSGTPS